MKPYKRLRKKTNSTTSNLRPSTTTCGASTVKTWPCLRSPMPSMFTSIRGTFRYDIATINITAFVRVLLSSYSTLNFLIGGLGQPICIESSDGSSPCLLNVAISDATSSTEVMSIVIIWWACRLTFAPISHSTLCKEFRSYLTISEYFISALEIWQTESEYASLPYFLTAYAKGNAFLWLHSFQDWFLTKFNSLTTHRKETYVLSNKSKGRNPRLYGYMLDG